MSTRDLEERILTALNAAGDVLAAWDHGEWEEQAGGGELAAAIHALRTVLGKT